jgi:hypothetical protein
MNKWTHFSTPTFSQVVTSIIYGYQILDWRPIANLPHPFPCSLPPSLESLDRPRIDYHIKGEMYEIHAVKSHREPPLSTHILLRPFLNSIESGANFIHTPLRDATPNTRVVFSHMNNVPNSFAYAHNYCLLLQHNLFRILFSS